jgi:8-amino-7-oxononanoate synthase
MKPHLERIQQPLGLVKMLQASGLHTYGLEVSSACQAQMRVEGTERINFISNSYMGFSTHPRVVEAVQRTVETYGVGIGGSPMACGNTRLHRQLADRLAANYSKPAAIVFASGYQALTGSIQGLLGRGDVALLDSLCHRSIIDGCLLAGCKVRSFRHNDPGDLAELLAGTAKQTGHRVVIVDSVYSMDGDLAPLPEIHALCTEAGVTVLIDEAHSLGIMGPTGKGLLEHFDLPAGADVVAGTFSKFAGAVGGFAAGDQDFIDYLFHYSSPFVFSASIPPVVVAAVLAAFEVLESEPQWHTRLWENVRFVTDGLKSLGFDTGQSSTPVIPIMIRDTERVLRMNRKLLDAGVYASPVVHPGVPIKQERIRLGVMATHTREQLERALDVLGAVGREFGVID